MEKQKNEPYLNFYPTLTLDEFRQLCFMTYCGEINDRGKSATAYRKRFKVSQKQYEECAVKLMYEGYLQTNSFVKPSKQFGVLEMLVRSYRELLDAFVMLHFERTKYAEYLLKVVQHVVKDDFVAASKVARPYIGINVPFNLFRYIQEQVLVDARYINLLNGSELVDMLDECLAENFANDDIDTDFLRVLSNAIPDSHSHSNELKDEISAYRYFMTGEVEKPAGSPTMWSDATKAVQLAYGGNLEDSYNMFRSALQKSRKQKNAFPAPLLNYVYGIVLYRLCSKDKYNEAYRQSMAVFRNAKLVRLDDENVSIRLLLDNLEQDSLAAQRDVNVRIGYVVNRHQEALYLMWNYLLYGFFGLSTSGLHKTAHSSLMLQHELSSYIPIGPDAKARLQAAFGGQPLIRTLRKKQAWELLLNDIAENIVPSSIKKEKRIAYYIGKTEINEVMEQYRAEDGVWHDGELLSLSLMASKGYESMNNVDMVIASQLNKANHDGASAIDILVTNLLGTHRLFYGTHYENQSLPVNIVEEKPYIEFNGIGTSIEVSSNVTLSPSGKVMRHTVRRDSALHFTVISANAFQRDIIKKFLQVKVFPSSALFGLRKTIDSLRDVIDIKENLLDISMQPAIISKGILAVRVIPVKNDYKVNVAAVAMEDGRARFVPAEGEEIVYDEVDGLTHCVNRDMNMEYNNYKELDSFLNEAVDAEVVSYADYKIYTLGGLLKLLSFVHDNGSRYFMEWPEGRPLKLKGMVQVNDIDILVASGKNWFEVEGKVVIGGKHYTLDELIKMCCSSDIEGFVKLCEDEYVRMSEKLKRHLAKMESLQMGSGGHRRVSKYQIGTFAAMLEGFNCQTDSGYTQLLEKTKTAYELTPDVPATVNAQLRGYQIDGFRWVCRLDAWGAGACLADDMGLGKTLQALSFLAYKANDGCSLVVAPKSVVLNWAAEARHFTPSLNIFVLNNVKNRAAVVENAGPNDIVLCTYGLLVTEADTITQKMWNVVCLDEAHQIKNKQTQVSHVAMEIKSDSRLILTGTPLQNNLSELWNLFQFINPGLLGTWLHFRSNFIIQDLDNEHKMMLKDMTQPFILRRTKKDVLTDLPEKLLHTHYVEMTDDEAKVYEEMRHMAEVKFKKHKTRAEKREADTLDLTFFAELMKLRQAACSMRLVYDNWTAQSSKVIALLEILNDIASEPDNNILVFSQFTSYLEMIKIELKKQGRQFLYLDGQTPLDKRQEMVDQFQNGQCKLFLSSLKAGGLGVNLTAANYVILLDPWWNPAIENQAMDRAHRIGQKRVVTVIRLISSQTIEEKILQLHETKQTLSDDMLDGTSETYKLTYEDIMDMVTPF
ncbi:MAG: DEAD/DEAH box helicase [Bacteroidales bacterium]|nr:DEAD/DEAH box helicase [Bacteroidales bacterium]